MIVRLMIPVAGLGLAACAAQTVEVRPIKPALAEGAQPVSARVAEGRAQLALGNVGLAQEAFRKALRDAPGDVDAMLGLAATYDLMGRGDLARKHYEMALAAKPKEPKIYAQFAQSLSQQGEAKEAARVTAEIATVSVAPETPAVVPSSVAVLPPPPTPKRSQPTLARSEPVAVSNPVVRLAPARSGPQLVRMSLAEVALVTTPQPQWQPRVVAKTAQSTTIRFEKVAARPVTLLNAARVRGLAARTRIYLGERGIRGVEIGDATTMRARSAILFGAADRTRAERIAAQFGFDLERRLGVKQGLTVLLGRDAAQDQRLRQKG